MPKIASKPYNILMCLKQYLWNKKKKNLKRVLVWYQPKTLWNLSIIRLYLGSIHVERLTTHWNNSVKFIQMDSSSPKFILFNCPLTLWVRDLPWTDSWSDGSTSLLRDVPRLTNWPRVINFVGTHGDHLVINLLEQSVPSFSCHSIYINLPLYPSFFTFHIKSMIKAQSSSLTSKQTVYLVHPSSTPFLLPIFNW